MKSYWHWISFIIVISSLRSISSLCSENRNYSPSYPNNGPQIIDERDEDIDSRAYRRGDWDYKQNWRYDRHAYYKGKTQPEAYEEEHPYGPAGIGYDPTYHKRSGIGYDPTYHKR